VSLRSANNNQEFREDISEYVAQLQLHMTLQARNLVPDLTDINSSRHQLLQETQAMIEKLASRQSSQY
jgi:acetyl-CoA carboxylase carboxyltransferase component